MKTWPASPRPLPCIVPQRPSWRSSLSLPNNAWQCGHPMDANGNMARIAPHRSALPALPALPCNAAMPRPLPCIAPQRPYMAIMALVVAQWMAMRAPTRGAPTIDVTQWGTWLRHARIAAHRPQCPHRPHCPHCPPLPRCPHRPNNDYAMIVGAPLVGARHVTNAYQCEHGSCPASPRIAAHRPALPGIVMHCSATPIMAIIAIVASQCMAMKTLPALPASPASPASPRIAPQRPAAVTGDAAHASRKANGSVRRGRYRLTAQHVCQYHHREVGNTAEDRIVGDKQRTRASSLFPHGQRGGKEGYFLGAQKGPKQGFQLGILIAERLRKRLKPGQLARDDRYASNRRCLPERFQQDSIRLDLLNRLDHCIRINIDLSRCREG